MVATKKAPLETERGSQYNPGGVLLSHPCKGAVPSAQWGLTAVFGMGTGISPTPSQPGNLSLSTRAVTINCDTRPGSQAAVRSGDLTARRVPFCRRGARLPAPGRRQTSCRPTEILLSPTRAVTINCDTRLALQQPNRMLRDLIREYKVSSKFLRSSLTAY
jgi:hypothetical protein